MKLPTTHKWSCALLMVKKTIPTLTLLISFNFACLSHQKDYAEVIKYHQLVGQWFRALVAMARLSARIWVPVPPITGSFFYL